MALEAIEQQMATLFQEFLERTHFEAGQLIVIGCSTSEVGGGQIGKSGNPEIAEKIFAPIYAQAKARGLRLAFQCCEHLNRALVVTRDTMRDDHLDQVTVVPHPHAGGSLASEAYRQMPDAVVVEKVQADGGLDIGETMIGMHLKPVAVPMRLSVRTIGGARVNAAYTRPKLIGGERAKYTLEG